MNRKRGWSDLVVAFGAAVFAGGVGLIYLPAGVIVAGMALVALGVLLAADGK